MALWLRQSTASQEILLGPFLDNTDGDTPATGLTIANTDIKLWKTGATSEANKNSGGATHIAAGRYYCVLDATDTGTLGPMEVNVHVAGALAVRRECLVLPAVIYDALVAGTGDMPIGEAAIATAVWSEDVTGYGGGSAGDKLNVANDTIVALLDMPVSDVASAAADAVWVSPKGPSVTTGTAQAGASASMTLASGASATTDLYKGQLVKIVSGTGAGQSRTITGYNGTTKVVDVDRAWATNPDNTSVYVVMAADNAFLDSSLRPTAASVAGNVVGNVNGNVVGSVGSLASQAQTDVRTAMTNQGYTTTRAGYMDVLNGLVQAIWDKLTSALTTSGSIGKLIVDTLDAAISTRATPAQVNTEADTALADVGLTTTITGRIDTTVSSRLAAAAYTSPPAVGAIADAVWDEAQSGHTTPGTFGEYLDAPVSSAGGGGGASAADIADAVWDEVASGHTTSGSMGQKLNSAGAAADPLLSPVPGSYAQGTAGHAIAELYSIEQLYPNILSPFTVEGDLRIAQGDDYLVANGRAIHVQRDNAIWPSDLTGATVVFTAVYYSGPNVAHRVQVTGSVVTATGANQEVKWEWAHGGTNGTDGLFPGTKLYDFEVVATLPDTSIATLRRGKMTVYRDLSP